VYPFPGGFPRDAILRLAGAGTASARLSAQTASAPQIRWNTELRRLAPNVYAYTQASGQGIDNASLSNAGVIVGDDLLPVFQLDQPRADRVEHHAPLRGV
jgi:hypothetical protein